MHRLAVFLNALRGRIVLWILLATAAVAGRAIDLNQWRRIVVVVTASLAIVLGSIMAYGLARHLASDGRRAGRLFGTLALALYALVIGVDAVALLAALGASFGSRWVEQAGTPIDVVLLGELTAFVALAPVAVSHGRLARALGAMDIRRRALNAALLVLFAALALSSVAWTRLHAPAAGLAVAAGTLAALLAVVALAKVLGVTRFLLAYLRTVEAPDSMDSLPELSAWHRA
jgi:hypothetical protein